MKPYFYMYHTFAKGRWFGKQIIEVLTSDYKTYSREYNVRIILWSELRLL